MNAADLLTQLRTSRERLLSAIGGLTEEGFRTRPGAGGWSVAEILVHVMDCEQRAAFRVAAALADDDGNPAPAADSADVIARWQGAPTPQIVHGLLAARRSLETQIAKLSDEDLARPVQDAEGPVAMAAYVRRLIEHELTHVAQIEAVRDAIRRERAPAL